MSSYGSILLSLMPSCPPPQPPNHQGKDYMERNSETLDCSSTFTQIVFRLADSSSPLCAHQLKCPPVARKRPLSPSAFAYLSCLCVFSSTFSFLLWTLMLVYMFFTLAHPGSSCSATSEHQACLPSKQASTSRELALVQSGLLRWIGHRGTSGSLASW